MPVLSTALEPRSETFRANAAAMRALVADLRDKSAAIALGGEEASRRLFCGGTVRPYHPEPDRPSLNWIRRDDPVSYDLRGGHQVVYLLGRERWICSAGVLARLPLQPRRRSERKHGS